MSNNTTAARIRADLKAAGYKATQVTCREPHYGSVTVTIRDASVSLSAVKAIANVYAVTRYCQGSGEILSGGVSVKVEYTDAVLAPVKAVVEALLEPAGRGIRVELGGGMSAAKSDRDGYVWIWGMACEGRDTETVWSVGYAATRIAIAYTDRKAAA